MRLKDKETTIAYICPECGQAVYGPNGFFTLSGDLFRLKCSCEDGSELTVTRKDGKSKISVPCLLCEEKHNFTLDEDGDFKSLVSLNCRYSGVGIAFVGKEEEIVKGVEKSVSALRIAALDGGFSSLEEFVEAKNANRKNREAVLTPDEAVALSSVITELTECGDITCHCGKCENPEVKVGEDVVRVSCPVCSASCEIPTVKIRNPYSLAEIMKIELI